MVIRDTQKIKQSTITRQYYWTDNKQQYNSKCRGEVPRTQGLKEIVLSVQLNCFSVCVFVMYWRNYSSEFTCICGMGYRYCQIVKYIQWVITISRGYACDGPFGGKGALWWILPVLSAPQYLRAGRLFGLLGLGTSFGRALPLDGSSYFPVGVGSKVLGLNPAAVRPRACSLGLVSFFILWGSSDIRPSPRRFPPNFIRAFLEGRTGSRTRHHSLVM